MEPKVHSDVVNGALGTELFVLQSVASSTISEAATRSTIYLSALSSGLVATGFASSSPELLAVLTLTVFPTIFLLGWFTVVRLVDTSLENITAKRRMSRIRAYYASLDEVGASLLTVDDGRTTGEMGVRYSRASFLFTVASMIGTVNSVLAGTLVTLVLTIALDVPTLPATAGGVVIGLGVLVATLLYERRRIGAQYRTDDVARHAQ